MRIIDWSSDVCSSDLRVPVFLRDLIIIGVDFRKGEEAVAVAAIIDERRLQRRFNPRHLGEVDITLELPPFSGFKIKFFYTVPVDDGDPGLLRVARVDEHALDRKSVVSGKRVSVRVDVGGRR